MKRLVILGVFFVSLVLVSNAKAAPHNGDLFRLVQPDGSLVEVKVFGDEFYQRVESLDGFTLIRDSSNWIVFAKLSPDGNRFESTGTKYTGKKSSGALKKLSTKKHLKLNPKARRSIAKENRRKHAPSGILRNPEPRPDVVGEIIGVTLIVDFSDEPAVIPAVHLEQLMNEEDFTLYGNNGSVREYFKDMSGDKLDYTNYVTGYYRAEHPKTYYDVADGDTSGGSARHLLLEALENLDEEGFDYTTLTINENNQIVAINCLYAGYPTQGWSQGLWPHQGYFGSFFADGVHSGRYQITNIGDSVRIGTICHENGHMIGLYADLYDYDGDSSGIGRFGLMGSGGGVNPVPINAYYRWISGWDEPIDITDAVTGTLFSSVSGYNNSFMYRNMSNENEFFFIETRYPSGRDLGMPAHGMIIWHADEGQPNNDDQGFTQDTHYYISVEQADGLFELEYNVNSGDPLDTFYKENVNEFSDSTSPDAKWWDDSNSGLHIGNVSSTATTMMFSIGNDPLVTYSASGTVKGIVDKYGKVYFDGFFAGSVPIELDETFSIPDLVEGTYTLYAQSHNYYSNVVEVTVPSSQEDIELEILMPGIEVETDPISITVDEYNTIGTAEFEISNPAEGILTYGTAIDTLSQDIVINEVYAGATSPPDGVELWNRGENISLGGWKLIFKDNVGTSGSYTFPSNYVLKEGQTLVATDSYDTTGNGNKVFIGFNLYWSYEDELELSVTLVDGIGDGVDFFRSLGSTDAPPLGTDWLGSGVEVIRASTHRVHNEDNDNAFDWISDLWYTINELNDGQTEVPSQNLETWLSVSPASDTVAPYSQNTVSVVVDGAGFPAGTVESDTVYVYHNAPDMGPPFKFQVEMTVEEGVFPDGGLDSGPDTDTDIDTDTDTDSDSDTDTDTDSDSDSASDSDDGCGCTSVGSETNKGSLLIMLLKLIDGPAEFFF